MAKSTIKPLNDRILVKRTEAESTTAGGIVLPDAAKEKPKEGVVVNVGTGKLLDSGERAPLQLKVKDRVIFGAYSGQEIKIDGEDFLIMGEDEVLAIVE